MGSRRIYATGSTAFWLNAFTDTPQLVGCCDQGRSADVLAAVPYLVQAGVTPEQTRLAVVWLQAMGVHAIVVNGPESTDEYKDYQQPERFASVLPVLHQERGDTIYAIPQRTASLAHVIHAAEIIPPGPRGVPDSTAVVRYASAIEDPARPEAQCDWTTPGKARIHAQFLDGDAVSIQVASQAGWKAWIEGRRQAVTADGLGFVLIRPDCRGDCTIALEWTGPSDFYLSAVVSLLALGVAAWLIIRSPKPHSIQ
jgi:hypothetical protein